MRLGGRSVEERCAPASATDAGSRPATVPSAPARRVPALPYTSSSGVLAVDVAAERVEGPVLERLHGTLTLVEHAGDLLDRQVGDDPQQDDVALVTRQDGQQVAHPVVG